MKLNQLCTNLNAYAIYLFGPFYAIICIYILSHKLSALLITFNNTAKREKQLKSTIFSDGKNLLWIAEKALYHQDRLFSSHSVSSYTLIGFVPKPFDQITYHQFKTFCFKNTAVTCFLLNWPVYLLLNPFYPV